MKPLSIAYIGSATGTSGHRARALKRLGNRVAIIDPNDALPANRFVRKWNWETGGLFSHDLVASNVANRVSKGSYDLAFVNGGELVDPRLVLRLKDCCGTVINYNNDDPFGGRDGRRWKLYLQAVPLYDLLVVVRECNVAEAQQAGARAVLRVLMSADEKAHAPQVISEQDQRQWSSEVAFVGTWMPERGAFLARLGELGVPLSIFGDRWQKAPEWKSLRPFWRGPGRFDALGYARIIQSAKVCLGLLSKGNRDESTTRSFEIPMLGGVLCAERTAEHVRLYEEGVHAVFWSTPEECAARCKVLLRDEATRRRLARNAPHRCIEIGATNEQVLREVLRAASAIRSGHSDVCEVSA